MKMLIFIIIILASGCLGGFLAWLSEREKVRWSTEEMERLNEKLKKSIEARKKKTVIEEPIYPCVTVHDEICIGFDKRKHYENDVLQAKVLHEFARHFGEANLRYAKIESIEDLRDFSYKVRAEIRIADMSDGNWKKIFEREGEE